MKSGGSKGWCPVLVLVLCFIGTHAQSGSTTGTFSQSSVALPSDLMNRNLTTLYNRQLKLADYAGKITIINIFASWCSPCRMNLTDLIKIKQEYQGRDVEVIGLVSQENDPNIASLRRFARLQTINFPVVWDDNGFGGSLDKAVNGLSVLPQTFIIDRNGRILKHFQGFSPTNMPVLMRQVLDQVATERKPISQRPSPVIMTSHLLRTS